MKTKVTEANQYSNHVFLKIHDYSEFASPFAYAVVFFMLYKPSCFEDVSLVDTLWNLAKFGISLLFIGLYFPVSKSIVKYPFLIFSIVLFSTILQNGIPAKVISHWIPGLGIICWLGANKNSLREIAKVFCICGGTMIILNTLTVFACPNGMWIRSEASTPIWFLGQKQDFICCYLPTAFFMVIPKKTDGFVFFNKAIVLFMVLPFLITRPIGLILCLLSFVGLIFLKK